MNISTTVARLWSNFVGIKLVQNIDFSRVSKKVLWTDCFRWPEGPAETIQIALSTQKGLKNTQSLQKGPCMVD